MIQEYQLRVLPEVAANEQRLKTYLNEEKGLNLRDITATRILKRSIDARQRTIFVNLTVRVYLNETPDDDEYTRTIYNNVEGKPQVIVVGAGPGGLFAALRLIELGLRPVVVERGKDVRERSIGWLHGNIGYVLQSPHLFSGTVRYNLTYGKEDATDAEIDAAVKSVNAAAIIERLDKGYDSEVGEGGNTLSTGEKQLLSFARAILVNPAIFVLDEATSSIDTITEKLIQSAIEKLMENRTSFVIAHRLSTIRSADIILVVDGGKIVERGSHAELIKKRGTYYNLYMRQFHEEQVQNSGAV